MNRPVCALHIVCNPTCGNDCYHTKNPGIDRAILIAAMISKIRQINAKERVKCLSQKEKNVVLLCNITLEKANGRSQKYVDRYEIYLYFCFSFAK